MFHSGQWGTVCDDGWTLTEAQVVCRSLNCGPALQFKRRTFYGPGSGSIWLDGVRCRGDERSLTECEHGEFGKHFCFNDEVIGVICSESVQLVSGRSLCSGSLQIRERSMSESWSWVCDGALDSRGAEVLCRELSCGAPLLQGALSPLDQMFHCEGHESSLMNCPRNQTRTNPETCSRLNLTCTEQLRLVGGASRCEGIMELEFRGEWRRLMYDFWNSRNLEPVVAVCQNLKCGSVVFTDIRRGLTRSDVWFIRSECMNRTNAALRDCIIHDFSALPHGLQMVCSDLLNIPEVSVSEGAGPVSKGAESPQGVVQVLMGAQFWVTCSVESQYPGGSFQLFSPTVNLTLPAVNHSAHFLFTDVSPAHTGNYTCVYLLHMFNYNFSSSSSILIINPRESSKSLVLLMIFVGVVLIVMATILTIYCKRRTDRGAGAGLGPESEGQYENIEPRPQAPPENIYEGLVQEEMEPTYEELRRNQN